jgi:hypothetical protein
MNTLTPERSMEVVGAVPPGLARQLQSVPAPHIPELARLPRPGERDPITGSSRSWLIDTNDGLPVAERFLFRVRQRGKMRGAVFINVAKLMALMKKAESEDAGTASGVPA